MKPEQQEVHIKFSTTQNHLESIGHDQNSLINEIEWMMKITGQVMRTLLGLNQAETNLVLDKKKINLLLSFNHVFRKVYLFKGFNRHLLEYKKDNVNDIFFNAQVAFWLSQKGYEIEFEPIDSIKNKRPDLLAIKNGKKISIECKNPNIDDFYQRDKKRKMADFVFKKLNTLHQFNFYLKSEIGQKEFESIFTQDLTKHLLNLGEKEEETRLHYNDKIEIGVIPKRDFVNLEEYKLQSEISGISVNVESGLRVPVFAFMQNARSIHVHGPVRGFKNRWNNYRRKSKEQGLSGLALIVIINGDNVLGEPLSHREYFDNIWLSDRNKAVSGLGLFRLATINGEVKLDYLPNKNGEYPIENFPE